MMSKSVYDVLREYGLTESTFLRNSGGKAHNVDWRKIPATILGDLVPNAAKVVLTNAYNSGGKDNPESARLAQMNKRRESWERGEYIMVERGESETSAMREIWVDEFRKATGATEKEANAFIRESVTECFGKDTKATFGAMMDVIAKQQVEDKAFDSVADARIAVESYYADKVAKRDAERAKVGKKLVMPKIDVSKFKKES